MCDISEEGRRTSTRALSEGVSLAVEATLLTGLMLPISDAQYILSRDYQTHCSKHRIQAFSASGEFMRNWRAQRVMNPEILHIEPGQSHPEKICDARLFFYPIISSQIAVG